MDGNAIIYCEGAFGTTNGKTANGLVRRTRRYRVLSVVDSTQAGKDAGSVLDGTRRDIPLLSSIPDAVEEARRSGAPATHVVVGLAPDGGRLQAQDRQAVLGAIELGLNVDSGLHDYLSEDPEIADLASRRGVAIRDIRKPPPRDRLHFFTGKIEDVGSLKVAFLGTDSAVGKRTTAWMVLDALSERHVACELVGTGQTAWLQGVRFGVIMDSLVNDFVSGEIEHAVWSAWAEVKPEVILIEGQGSIMNPAYPGGFEIMAAGRPDLIVLQHAPARREYDGFPGYPLHSVERQMQVLELLSGKPVIAVAVSREGLKAEQVPEACRTISERTGVPVYDVLREGGFGIADLLMIHLGRKRRDAQ
jgi:uncharacterized NAD-dependent epimerase/dehydratase family protein